MTPETEALKMKLHIVQKKEAAALLQRPAVGWHLEEVRGGVTRESLPPPQHTRYSVSS